MPCGSSYSCPENVTTAGSGSIVTPPVPTAPLYSSSSSVSPPWSDNGDSASFNANRHDDDAGSSLHNSSLSRVLVAVRLDHREVGFTLTLAVLAVLCNVLVLFLTKFAGGGRSPTMVFVRMLCVSDFLLGCYGVGKMVMFLYVDELLVNFFLPESLFLTATTSACLSLFLLNLDRCLKISAPLWYARHVDKQSIITGMVFLWNASFILGFLPLLGWNGTVVGAGSQHWQLHELSFFRFFPWHYLLVMGLLWLLCVCGSVLILLLARRRFDRALADPQRQLAPYHHAEVGKYCKLRVTLALDVATWALCYLPYLLYVGLACHSCPLGPEDVEALPDRGVYHFVPVFMLRALGGAWVQLYRTVRVQGLVKLQRGSSTLRDSLRRCRECFSRLGFHKRSSSGENGVATISYSNPLCDHNYHRHSLGASSANMTTNASSTTEFSSMDDLASGGGRQSGVLLTGRFGSHGYYSSSGSSSSSSLGRGESRGGDGGSSRGIANPAYRPSIDLPRGILGVTVENTAF